MNSSILTPPTSHLYPLTNPWQLFADLHIDHAFAADAGAGAVPTGEAPAPVAKTLDGEQVYNAACMACHGSGVAGAPKFGDAGAWKARIAQGADTLHKHALEGFQGAAGVMPPKGGRTDLSDAEVMAAVDFMVAKSR